MRADARAGRTGPVVKAAVDCNALVGLDIVDPHPNQALRQAAAPQLPEGTHVSKHPLAAFCLPFPLRANPRPASPPAGLFAGATLPGRVSVPTSADKALVKGLSFLFLGAGEKGF